MRVGLDGVFHDLRVTVHKPLSCADGCVSVRAHIGLFETRFYTLNMHSTLQDGINLADLREGHVLIAKAAGKQIISAESPPKLFTLEGFKCSAAFFKAVDEKSGNVILQTNDLSRAFEVSSETRLMNPVDANAAFKILKEGYCSVNVWTRPDSDNVEAMSINFR